MHKIAWVLAPERGGRELDCDRQSRAKPLRQAVSDCRTEGQEKGRSAYQLRSLMQKLLIVIKLKAISTVGCSIFVNNICCIV